MFLVRKKNTYIHTYMNCTPVLSSTHMFDLVEHANVVPELEGCSEDDDEGGEDEVDVQIL